MKTTTFSRVISLVLVFAMLFTMLVFTAGAKTTDEGLFTYVIEGETVTILKCSDKATGEVVIPAEIDGKTVTKIDKGAFEGCKSVTSLVIPEGVTVIGGETADYEIDTEDYFGLFVKDGLVYHLNFANAKEGDTIVGGAKYEDPDALATDRFAAVASNYAPHYAYLREGITNPFTGGTATILEGWKFATPYKYSHWFNEDGSFTGNSTIGTDPDVFVTEEPGEGVVVNRTSSRTIDGTAYTLYHCVYQAPEGITDYYIGDGVWEGRMYASAFGDGYLNIGLGNVPTLKTDATMAAVNATKKYTVNLVISIPTNSHTTLFMGVPYNLNNNKGSATLSAAGLTQSYITDTGTTNYKTVEFRDIDTVDVNSFSFTVDATDVANNNVKLGFYANGASYGTQDLVSQINTMASSTWQLAMRDNATKTYALRLYDKVLTDEENLQNNFADIATIAKLNIKEFLKLSDTEKQVVYAAFEGRKAEDDKATLQLILDVATGVSVEDMPAEIDYEDLFVKDGLIYHINFANAVEGTVIAAKNPNAELAGEKFPAAADTFDNYYFYKASGITRPWAGGTATISEGGWKFLTPYIESYWFNDDGTLAHTSGSTATFANFVTETGLEGVPYYMKDENYVVAEPSRTIGGETKTTYKLLYEAPENATGYYIADGVWGGPAYSSSFGNGYFHAGKGNTLTPYGGGIMTQLTSAKEFTVELTAASTQLTAAAYFIGPRFEFQPKADNVLFTGGNGNEMLAAESGYTTVKMALKGADINTYTFTFDLYDNSDEENLIDIATNYKYILNAYGNGTNYSTQTLVSKTAGFAATNQFLMRGNGINTYAMRVYDRELSAEEVLQNNFADIATIAKLDLSGFAKATAEKKAEVYAAFEGLTASTDKADLQATLDEVLAPPTYYDLYVKEDMVYHLNFKDAKATDSVVGSAKFEDENESASVRFLAAPSNFLAHTKYRMAGVPDGYINSATASILPGWKFATPYKYSWWFNEDGTATKNSTTGSNLDAVVTSPLTEQELDALEALTGFRPTLLSTSTRAYNGDTKTLHHYLYQAPDGITEYFIGNGIWEGRKNPTVFGDGYINFGNGTAPYYAYSNTSVLLCSNNKLTVETTMASVNGSSLSLYAGGVRYSLTYNSAEGIVVSSSAEVLAGEAKRYVAAGQNNKNINQYVFTIDGTNLESGTFDVANYVNGAIMGEKTTIPALKSAIANEFQYCPRGAGINTYAIRLYNDVLTADEVLQNHFADIVNINSLELDIEAFLELDADDKQAVYTAFADSTINDDAAELQTILDTALGVGVEKSMFADCAALESVTVLAETAPELIEDAFKGAPLTEILVPEASVDAYKEAWPEYAELIAAYIPPATEPPVTTETPVTPEPPVSSEPAVTTQTPVETEPVISTEIPYKANISMTLTDNGDGTFSADEIFGEANTFDFVEKGAGYAVGGAEAANQLDTTVSYAWDGQYIYVYAVTQDDTLIAVSQADAEDAVNNYKQDSFELWYYLGAAPTDRAQVRQFLATRTEYFAMNAQSQVISNFFGQIEWAHAVNEETGTTYLLFKIPAKTEEGTALKGGDVFYTAIQMDDKRVEGEEVYYCTTGNSGSLDNFDAYVLADTGAGDIMYGDVNGDTQINAIDVVTLRKYMADFNFETGTSSVEVEAGADVNGDTTINAVDVVILRKYMADYDFETGSSSVVLGPSQNQ